MLRRKVAMEEMGAAYMAHGIVTLAGSRLYLHLPIQMKLLMRHLTALKNVFKTVHGLQEKS